MPSPLVVVVVEDDLGSRTRSVACCESGVEIAM
jgi:hypothetical protein